MIHHKEALQAISELSKIKEYTLETPNQPFDRLSAKVHFKKDGFHLTPVVTNLPKVQVGDTYSKIVVNAIPTRLVLHRLYIHTESNFVPSGTSGSASSYGYQEGRKYYYRLIIPLDEKLDWHFNIEEAVFETDLGFRSRTGIMVETSGETFIVCSMFKEEKAIRFLSIESDKKQKRNTFWHKAYCILCAIGYLTGKLPGNACFFFAYQNSEMRSFRHFYFTECGPSIRHSYHPVYSNPYGYLHRQREIADDYYTKKKLRPVSRQEFSSLCQKLMDYDAFQNVIVLMMESLSASTGLMPGGLAMALESLTDIILGDLKVSLRLIQDPLLKKNVLKGLRAVVQSYEKQLGPEAFKILAYRIDNINQGTNRARLKAPFEHVKIRLLKSDLAILETRNDFLHGKIPDIRGLGEDRPLLRKTRDCYYAAMRLYTIMNMLILKWIGYDNYVLNNPVLQKHICQVPLREKPYRRV